MQLSLDFSPQTKGGITAVDTERHLKALIEDGEPLVYLYGQNKFICFARTHSSTDTKTIYPIAPPLAKSLLRPGYQHHCNHVSHDGKKACVYLRNR